MRKIQIVLYGIILIMAVSACQKYEEGPLISFRSVERRLQGEFQAEAFEIDGQDAMQIWNDSICDNYLEMYWQDAGIKNFLKIKASFGGCFGQYTLYNHNEMLKFEIMDQLEQYPGYGPFKKGIVSEWKILKLSNKRLWIKSPYDGSDYLLKLKKIKDVVK